ncbi:phosphate regulon sensor histidine kinase PhoR [Oleiagrimonas soli]|uniref:Phosphate regulon sensor protein PhoR n=1 Tax=Oleiagrimonas soli TaxID=1543381 RepID=A0A099CZC6_9GAMM|nr:phosphate regulon sensor histidine kinase PhoR [Oleiagrimonas soli]KGI78385.1 histidine kinase [Oleiagrimonas soli]MBB6183752.1 two-component system phosphate regulon sensor histidine kinase PhoR [Oleiagrimonas soli]
MSVPGFAATAASVIGGVILATLLGAAIGQTLLCLSLAALIAAAVLLVRVHRLGVAVENSRFIPDARYERLRLRSRRLSLQLRDLRNAAAALPDAAVLLDGEGRIRWFNHASEDLLGLRRPQDRGTLLIERLRESTLGPWLESGAEKPLNDVPAPNRPALRLGMVMMPFGHHQRLMLGRDISDLMRLEQVRQDFVANVSHELRTPLTVIHGYLELLDPEDQPELAPVIAEMRVQSERMGQIVEDLLMLSRLETHQPLQEEHVAMRPLLATLRKEALALSHGRHHIELQERTDTDLYGSVRELHSAFSNLVSNAVRYTPTQGRITLIWERTDEGARFTVEDTGYGIPANHLARLTERFYRVSSSRSRDTGGTGLGLSIVKHVLNRHQAQLHIESEPGHGSRFSCRFGSMRLLKPIRLDA